jgi:hypothetical protein
MEFIMAAASYPIRRVRPLRRGLSLIEFALAVAVIGGLTFVTFRVKNMEISRADAQSAAKTAAGATLRITEGKMP